MDTLLAASIIADKVKRVVAGETASFENELPPGLGPKRRVGPKEKRNPKGAGASS